MDECLSLKHVRELSRDSLKYLLDGSRVGDKCAGDRFSFGRHITNRVIDIIGDPRNELVRLSGLHIGHLLVDVLRWDCPAEDAISSQVFTLTRIARNHHVERIKHLLRKLSSVHLAEVVDALSV